MSKDWAVDYFSILFASYGYLCALLSFFNNRFIKLKRSTNYFGMRRSLDFFTQID